MHVDMTVMNLYTLPDAYLYWLTKSEWNFP